MFINKKKGLFFYDLAYLIWFLSKLTKDVDAVGIKGKLRLEQKKVRVENTDI